MSTNPMSFPIQLKINKPIDRRPSKPAVAAPHEIRRCILVDCETEDAQRDLFEHLRQQGMTCRPLTL